MRNLTRYLILLGISVFFCSCKIRIRDDERSVTFSIPGLVGAECSKSVLQVLNQHNGILNAMPDLTNRTIRVEFNSRTTAIKNIEHAIAGAGFDVDDTQGNAEAKSKLPPDCR